MLLSLLLNGLAVGSIYALLALSIVLIHKSTGVINFAQGEMSMFGTFVAYSTLTKTGLPLPVVFLLGFPFGALLGLAVQKLVMEPIRKAPELNRLVTTIGLWFVFNSTAGWIWGYDPYRFPSLLPDTPIDIAGSKLTPSALAVIGVTVALLAALYLFFEHTREGVAMRAASSQPRSARLMGINISRVAVYSWMLAGGISIVSGMLIAPITFLDQQMMFSVLLKSFAGAILGGFGSLPGAVVGGLILGVLEVLLGAYVSNVAKDAFAFVLIIAMLMVWPSGLFGRGGVKKV